MSWHISFEMQGDQFRPSLVPFSFTEQYDTATIRATGRYRGQPSPFGVARYEAPSSIPNAEKLRHVLLTMEPVLPAIRAAGATEWHVSILRAYATQCNEQYSLENLQLMVQLGCGFTYSAYCETEEQ